MHSSGPRYAVYFAPAKHTPLWTFGSRVLGYDAATGRDEPFLLPESLGAGEWVALTEEPRRYGFHATLKAPFRLAHAVGETRLVADFDAFCERVAPVRIDALSVETMGRFIALLIDGSQDAVSKLASAAVEAFEPHRAPLTRGEIERRMASALTPPQLAYLERYGYPYVHDAFRFHMTLAGPSDRDRAHALRDGLAAIYRTTVPSGPVVIDALALYRQATPQDRFRIIRRTALTAS